MPDKIVSWATNVVLVFLCLTAVTVAWIRIAGPERATTSTRGPVFGPGAFVPDWPRYSDGGHTIGDSTVAHEFVIFSDFTCAGCEQLASHLRVLSFLNPDRIGYTFRHFPLSDSAAEAALYSECAGHQEAFTRMHDALFEHRILIGEAPPEFFAVEARVPDISAFSECLAFGEMDVVQQDRGAAESLGLVATPAWMYQGQTFTGAPDITVLQSVLGLTDGDRTGPSDK